jgi:hypothetical protein
VPREQGSCARQKWELLFGTRDRESEGKRERGREKEKEGETKRGREGVLLTWSREVLA